MKDPVLTHPLPRAQPAPTQILKVQKVSLADMEERCKQRLGYYCDEKYSPRHRSREENFFHIDVYSSSPYEYISYDESLDPDEAQPNAHIEAPIVTSMELEEPIISLHALSSISTPHTLNLKGYIKHHLVVVLIDSGNTHNFIHHRLADEIHCFVFLVSNFQILIANGGTMKCGGRCENVKLKMGDYTLKTHMFSFFHGWM
jgi:hypothetical protein